jgi:hypothetical protein
MTSPLLRCYRAAFIALVALPVASLAQDVRTVTGTVTDSAGQPIPYVNVDGGPRFRTLSNGAGEWRLQLPANEAFEINLRRIGYLANKVRIEKGADTTVTTSLQRLAVLLTTQVVRAQQQVRSLELRGFYERMSESQRGALVGEFVTPEEIEMRNPQRVTQLLEQRRGITVRRVGSCAVVSTCYYVMGTGGCAATVYLDGARLNRMATGSAPAIDELIPVTGVSGIEVYPRGSSAPPKYQALAGTCAVIVIWTK